MKWFKTLILFVFFIVFFLSFPDKHIDFWTTVEDGNLSQTFFIIIIIIIWKYKYKIILSTSEMWETPIHFSLFYNRAWASHTRRPERCFQTSVRSVSSRGKKSVNIKKWASVRNGQGNQRGKASGENGRRPKDTNIDRTVPIELHVLVRFTQHILPLNYYSLQVHLLQLLHDTWFNSQWNEQCGPASVQLRWWVMRQFHKEIYIHYTYISCVYCTLDITV